jgi:23S rRNA A2030 N6-methylase RlmJ
MLIANPPWKLDATLAALLPPLRDVLAQSAGASENLRWLRGE